MALELVLFKVVECKEVIPKESCISEEEYELMIQCCTRELSSRPKVIDIRQRLTKLREITEGNQIIIVVDNNRSKRSFILPKRKHGAKAIFDYRKPSLLP